MIEPLIYLGISFVFAGLIVWAIMPLVHRRAARLFDARVVGQLRDKVLGQSAELEKNAKTITQLNVDRDLLKVELDALRIQHADMGQLRDAMNRLETERD